MSSTTLHQNATASTTAFLQRRIAGVAIDMALMTMIMLVLRQILGTGIMSVGLMTVLAVAVHGVVQGETGVTPGKAIMGLKLVNEQGRPPGTGPALIRLAAWSVDGLPCLGAFGILLIWFTPTHQRVGDTITRTFVVSSTEESADGQPTPTVAPGPAPDRYTGGDEELRQDFDPIWDTKVQAYVQWDPAEKHWVKYDNEADAWVLVEQG